MSSARGGSVPPEQEMVQRARACCPPSSRGRASSRPPGHGTGSDSSAGTSTWLRPTTICSPLTAISSSATGRARTTTGRPSTRSSGASPAHSATEQSDGEVTVNAVNRRGRKFRCRVRVMALNDDGGSPYGVILLMSDAG